MALYRNGRAGAEIQWFHPRLLASTECIPPGHALHACTYPSLEGQWYPELEVLDDMASHLAANPPLLEWAYYEAERVLIQELEYPEITPTYMYPEGDRRPHALRAHRSGSWCRSCRRRSRRQRPLPPALTAAPL